MLNAIRQILEGKSDIIPINNINDHENNRTIEKEEKVSKDTKSKIKTTKSKNEDNIEDHSDLEEAKEKVA